MLAAACHPAHTVKFNGEKLRQLREARKWDQHELATRARQHSSGVNQASVSRHENGMEPTNRNAAAYARALGVHVIELYDLDDDEEEAASMASSRETEIYEALRPLARALAKELV